MFMRLLRGVVQLVRRQRFERELLEEMQLHRDLRAAKLRGTGVANAELAARRRFGNALLLREESRDAWGWRWLDMLAQDIRSAFRMLLKKPAFVLIAIFSLALGIGANTVIFSLIKNTLLRPLPFRDPDRLVAIWTVPVQRSKQTDSRRDTTNVSAYLAWRARNRSFESMGAFFGIGRTIGAEQNGAAAERIFGQFFTPSLFETLGVKPAMGRSFTEDEGRPEANAPVVLISDGLWQRRFSRDPNILGRTILLDGIETTIIGVMPPGFTLL